MKKQFVCEIAKDRDSLKYLDQQWRKVVMRLLKHTIRSTPINEVSLYSLPATPEVSKILHELEDYLFGM
jgi:hypothetical protein